MDKTLIDTFSFRFIYYRFRRKILNYCLNDLKWKLDWRRFLLATVDGLGVWFNYDGDEVVWTWPWKRDSKRPGKPFISLGFSGNGDFGDARFASLVELRDAWRDCEDDIEFHWASSNFDEPWTN